MSILDTFFILFKSDTSELKKGANEALNIINNFKSTLLSIIPAGIAAFSFKGALDFGVKLAQTSRILGANVEDLNAWRNTIELAGGDANQFENTVASMANRFNTSSQTILKLLPRYAEALSKLSPARAQQIGKNLFGLDEGTILLLQHSRREVEDMVRTQKELGVVTHQNAEQFLLYQQATKKLDIEFRNLFLTLAIDALPYFIKFLDLLQKGTHFLSEHKDFVTGLSIAIGALAARFAFAKLPITLVSAALIGLGAIFALVYDDIQVFLKGGDSIIGFFVDKFPTAAKIFKDTFVGIGDSIIYLYDRLVDLQHILDKIDRFAWNKIRNILPSFSGIGTDIFASVRTPPSSNFLQSQSLSNDNNSKKVEINNMVINSPAVDAPGFATDLLGALNSAYSQTANYHADGVLA